MSIQPNNLPIYFQKFTNTIIPVGSQIFYSSIVALPTNSPLNRVWSFIYRGEVDALTAMEVGTPVYPAFSKENLNFGFVESYLPPGTRSFLSPIKK